MSKDIIDTLEEIAYLNPKRADFNRAVRKAFPKCLGHGAFRSVFAADDMVIKIRRSRPNGSGFRMSDIQTANQEEAEHYETLAMEQPLFANFVLPPIYYTLPNDHDAVVMRRVEKVWGKLRQSVREKHEDGDTLLGRQYRIISNVFQDAHWGNIGLLNNRLYLIDLNQGFHDSEWLADCAPMATSVLTELGEIKPKAKALKAGA